jgi:ABC-type glutathione transport system ATPase component
MVLLRAEGLRVENARDRGQPPVLRSVGLEIGAGRTAVLLGESGAGKTVLARALCGLLPNGLRISRGFVAYRGERLETEAAWSRVRGRKIFYAPQNAAASLNPVLTIGRQLDEGRRLGKGRLQEILAGLRLADPQRVLASYPFMLSGGENQRCLLAMALVAGAELLILDEPTAELDPTAQADFVRVLLEYQRCHGPAILLISHHLDLVRAVADDLYVLHGGAIVAAGAPVDVLAAPGHPYTREIAAYLGGG